MEMNQEDVQNEIDVLRRGGLRSTDNMLERGFAPVWMNNEYPGKVPDEIAKIVDHSSGCYIAGSNRSIFWLSGYDDLVKVVDDPAYKLQDEVVATPFGKHPGNFLISRYGDEGKIPRDIQLRFDGYVEDPNGPCCSVFTMTPFKVPTQITSLATNFRLGELYPLCRPQAFPQQVCGLRLKYRRNTAELFNEALLAFGDEIMLSPNVLFRGLSLMALELSMTSFVPTIDSRSCDNEFGPGIYTSNDFHTAKEYAGASGAIMVFMDVDFDKLTVWEPVDDQWRRLTARSLRIPQDDLSLDEAHKQADVIHGPMSYDRHLAKKFSHFPTPGKIDQMVFVSVKGCEALSRGFVGIIYMEDEKVF